MQRVSRTYNDPLGVVRVYTDRRASHCRSVMPSVGGGGLNVFDVTFFKTPIIIYYLKEWERAAERTRQSRKRECIFTNTITGQCRLSEFLVLRSSRCGRIINIVLKYNVTIIIVVIQIIVRRKRWRLVQKHGRFVGLSMSRDLDGYSMSICVYMGISVLFCFFFPTR